MPDCFGSTAAYFSLWQTWSNALISTSKNCMWRAGVAHVDNDNMNSSLSSSIEIVCHESRRLASVADNNGEFFNIVPVGTNGLAVLGTMLGVS